MDNPGGTFLCPPKGGGQLGTNVKLQLKGDLYETKTLSTIDLETETLVLY